MSAAATNPSLAYVRRALSELPRLLEDALRVPLPPVPPRSTRIVTTGIGGSEAPARMLAARLADAGLAARFCPTSQFLAGHPSGDLLVVFSQGLSPNGGLAFPERHGFGARWLVTSICASASPTKQAALAALTARGVVPIVVPPAREEGSLVRLIGPTVAALVALRLAAHLRGDPVLADLLEGAPAAYEASEATSPLAEDAPVALVTVGSSLEAAQAHRWKLLEALLLPDPPVWDVLQFAHGPLQATHRARLTLITCEAGPSHAAEALVTRLEQTLVPSRHRLLRLSSGHAPELAFFAHAGMLDALLLATLSVAPRDLFDWPARNADGPLYGLGAEPREPTP